VYLSVCNFIAVELECPSEAKRATTVSVKACKDVCLPSSQAGEATKMESNQSSSAQSSVSRISLPLLSGSIEAQYKAQRTEEDTALVWNCDILKCDEPLQLRLPWLGKRRTLTDSDQSSEVHLTDSSKQTCVISKNNAICALMAAYNDDTEEL